MRVPGFEGRPLRDLIAAWLDATRGTRVPVGLEIEEALRRARELQPLIVAGRISTADVEIDEEFKDVLYALVRLLSETGDERPAKKRDLAKATYAFIAGIAWDEDPFWEKRKLLSRCLAAGGLSASEVPLGAGADPTARCAADVFRSALPEIREMFQDFELTATEAALAEKDLFAWFTRFARRLHIVPIELRPVLLSACSLIAQQYLVLALRTGSPLASALDLRRPSSELKSGRGPADENV